MALRRILVVGDEILRKTSKVVTRFDESLWDLLDDMKETLKKSDGVGLAAPQVGVLKRVFVISLNNYYLEVINPVIKKQSGTQKGQEGCLSVPNRSEEVVRPKTVTMEFVDRYNNPVSMTVSDFMARAFCHEFDHLNGILYIDLINNNKENYRR